MECVKGLVLTLPVSAAYNNGKGWRRGRRSRMKGSSGCAFESHQLHLPVLHPFSCSPYDCTRCRMLECRFIEDLTHAEHRCFYFIPDGLLKGIGTQQMLSGSMRNPLVCAMEMSHTSSRETMQL